MPTEEIEPEAAIEEVEPEAIIEETDEEELPDSLEEIFAIKPEMLDVDIVAEDEEEMEQVVPTKKKRSTKKKKKTQKKYVDIEYDPEADVTLYRKRRKGEGDEWEDDDWEY